jgi:hypothetical protein
MLLARFRTYKIASQPQTKTEEWRWPQTDKHLPQSPFTGQYFSITTFGIAFYQSNLSAEEMLPLEGLKPGRSAFFKALLKSTSCSWTALAAACLVFSLVRKYFRHYV